jgi:predicted nuclease of restriction endonuclease-like (RecB) superfamily
MATKNFGWSKNVLVHQIENKTYEKYLLGQTNFDTTLPVRNWFAIYFYWKSVQDKD